MSGNRTRVRVNLLTPAEAELLAVETLRIDAQRGLVAAPDHQRAAAAARLHKLCDLESAASAVVERERRLRQESLLRAS